MKFFDLGLADVSELQNRVKNNSELRNLGLGPLANGEKIKRETWHSLGRFLSQFQQAARQLELGTPHREF